jgi:chitin synthase
MDDLRTVMKTLGFKPKHLTSIFSLLVTILLGNLQFGEADHSDVSAHISNTQVLDHVARLLGISSEDLSLTLTNKTSYVRKDLYMSLLNAEQSVSA